MFRDKDRKYPKYYSKKKDEKIKEFRAVINENISVVIAEKRKKIQVVVKKELLDYKLEITASEAPVKNYAVEGGEILPFEHVVAETAILEEEIFNVNRIIKELFGKKYDLRLKSLRLCVGSDESNYLTIDEKDLKEVDVIPTINGLKSFIQTNKKSILGFTIRHYDSKKGNLIFCECELTHPIFDLRSIKIKVLANLSQRGLYMQKHHQGYGLHLYYTLDISRFSDIIIRFFNELKIPIEMLYLKRKSSIQSWRAIECELNDGNLKNYLQSQFSSLSHTDVENVVSIVHKNKFNFDIANMMADLLNQMKTKRVKIDEGLYVDLDQEDIAAAAKWVVNYFGFNEADLSLPTNLDVKGIQKSIDELDLMVKKSIDKFDFH